MKTFSKEKGKIKRYEDEISDLKKQLEVENNNLFTNIIDEMLITKFMMVKFEGRDKEYYYISTCLNNEISFINGIKLTKKGIECGKISICHLKDAKEYHIIEPYVFFANLEKYGVKLDKIDEQVAKECLLYKPLLPIQADENDKIKCVGYCRLSNNTRVKNGYDRQMTIISKETNDCYVVKHFFSETLSGTIPLKERKEINELLDYCEYNNINILFVSEMDRIGREQNVIIEGISYLMKHGINEIHLIKENVVIDKQYLIENYRTLTNMAKKCEDEYKNIVHRMRTGYKSHMVKVKNGEAKVGRPSTYKKSEEEYRKQYGEEIDLLNKHLSLRNIHTITGTSVCTLRKIVKILNIDRTNKHNVVSVSA